MTGTSLGEWRCDGRVVELEKSAAAFYHQMECMGVIACDLSGYELSNLADSRVAQRGFTFPVGPGGYVDPFSIGLIDPEPGGDRMYEWD